MPTHTTVDIPADWLAQNPSLPDRCAAHGLPAVRRVTFAVRSNPKISPRKKAFLPGYTSLNRAEEYARQVQIAKVSGWPLCSRCVRQRRVGLVAAGVLFFGGLLAMIGGFVAGAVDDGSNPGLLVPILTGFAAMLLSPIPLSRASLMKITRTQLTPDGTALRVSQPSSQFVAQLPQTMSGR